MLRLLKCIFSFFCSSVSTSPSSFSVSLPFPIPPFVSLTLSPYVCFCWSQQTCQPVSCFWRQGLALFLFPSSCFLSFFTPPLCSADASTHMRFSSYTNARAHIAKLILSLSVSSTSSRCLALSLSKLHAHKNTHTVPITHSYTGIVFKCSNKYEWAQNDECMSK